MVDDFVTTGEFSRWRADFQGFQARLNDQLHDGFTGIHARLDQLNGRTRQNSEMIASSATELELVKEDIDLIRDRGCAQLASHRATLAGALAPPADFQWTKKHTAVTGAAGAAGAAILALVEFLLHWAGLK
jgi:hypothetical protein